MNTDPEKRKLEEDKFWNSEMQKVWDLPSMKKHLARIKSDAKRLEKYNDLKVMSKNEPTLVQFVDLLDTLERSEVTLRLGSDGFERSGFVRSHINTAVRHLALVTGSLRLAIHERQSKT